MLHFLIPGVLVVCRRQREFGAQSALHMFYNLRVTYGLKQIKNWDWRKISKREARPAD